MEAGDPSRVKPDASPDSHRYEQTAPEQGREASENDDSYRSRLARSTYCNAG
jgi:hypothetical protein